MDWNKLPHTPSNALLIDSGRRWGSPEDCCDRTDSESQGVKSLRGFKFDWSRNDANFDHVYANQAFTHKLNEFGIVHQAEEFNDTSGEPDWGADGRLMTEVLPFFARYLFFDTGVQTSR